MEHGELGSLITRVFGKIKPCPFCDWPEVYLIERVHGVSVYCPHCDAVGPIYPALNKDVKRPLRSTNQNEDETIHLWNYAMRTSPEIELLRNDSPVSWEVNNYLMKLEEQVADLKTENSRMCEALKGIGRI